MKRPFVCPHCGSGFNIAEARFWEKVDKRGPDECWLWKASKTPFGYGRFNFAKGFSPHAHRTAFYLANGPIPKGLYVCHSCDTPACVNPKHLFLGTPADNMADKIAKGRHSSGVRPWGAKVNTSKLSASDAIAIYRSRKDRDNLAKIYGVSTTAIRLIQIGKNWSRATKGIPR